MTPTADTRGCYKRFDVQAFWSAALAEHRRRKHKTFGWHYCKAPSCVARQREFDATERVGRAR